MSTQMTETIAETLSTFTTDSNLTVDDFIVMQDLSTDALTNISRYQTLLKKTTRTTSEETEMTNLLTELEEYMPTSAMFNKLIACIMTMQMFMRDGIVTFIKQKQTEWEADLVTWTSQLEQFDNMGTYSETTTYKFANIVKYNGYGFICLVSCTGQTPSVDGDTTYWMCFTIKGDRGLPSLNVSCKGVYSETTTYNIGDACLYNDILYYTLVDGTIGILPSVKTNWATMDRVVMSSTEPSDATLIWIDTTSNYTMKYYSSGTSTWKATGIGGYTANGTLKTGEQTDLITAINEINTDRIFYGATSNSGNVYTSTISGVSSYYTGLGLCLLINANSTGAITININSVGAKNLLDAYGNTLSSTNTLKAGIPYTMRYNGTAFILQGKGGGGNVTDPYVLNGYTYTNNNGMSTGTMTNYIGWQKAPSYDANAYTGRLYMYASKGYYAGVDAPNGSLGVYTDDTNFIASNILANKSVFGLVGTGTSDATATTTSIVNGYSAYVNGSKITGIATVQSLGGYAYASGTVEVLTSDVYKHTFCFVDSSLASNKTAIKVTGLSFTPKIIIIGGNSHMAVYNSVLSDGYYSPTVKVFEYDNNYLNSSVTVYNYKGDANDAYVSSTGFCMPAPDNSSTFSWFAVG